MSETENASGKGRPTPRRKDAESKRKQTLKVPTDKKAAKRALREREYEARLQLRRAMYTNDEKFLPARDRGPVRRFVRNFVDSRVSIGEVFVPFAFIILIALSIPSPELQATATSVWLVMFVGLIADGVILGFRLRRALSREFSDVSTKGAISYGVLRSINMRLMRMPKPMVKVGGAPRPVKLPKSLRD
jgi:hypothetical protein